MKDPNIPSDELNQEAVTSPCIRRCCLDDNDVCVGCCRTIDEIVGWSASSITEKRKIIVQCEERKAERRRQGLQVIDTKRKYNDR